MEVNWLFYAYVIQPKPKWLTITNQGQEGFLWQLNWRIDFENLDTNSVQGGL